MAATIEEDRKIFLLEFFQIGAVALLSGGTGAGFPVQLPGPGALRGLLEESDEGRARLEEAYREEASNCPASYPLPSEELVDHSRELPLK